MGRRGNARLVERAFFFVTQAGEQRTDFIREHIMTTHGTAPSLANMTQALLSSGLFKRVGWYDRINDTLMRTEKSSKQLGIKNARYVCVVDTKSLDEIIDAYVSGKKTIRSLDRMPTFVRHAVRSALDD
tara:strand:- start:538 stop:924 length:387 start_codon:yes stop_codon:yes gene_type:complete